MILFSFWMLIAVLTGYRDDKHHILFVFLSILCGNVYKR